MKSPYLFSLLAAVTGFAIAWAVKPTPAVPSQAATTPAAKTPVRSGPVTRSSTSDRGKIADVKASDFPLAEQAELGPKSREEAKMLRLTEALGLSLDQQGSLIKLIGEVQATADGNAPVIEDLTARGNAVQAGLEKILTAEQFSKFQELRARERENRVELRAQKLLTGAIEEIDLSPDQREEVLVRLRQRAKAELQVIPAAATLLFDKSMLPTGGKELPVDGILVLAKLGEQTLDTDPTKIHDRVLANQKRELEEILRCFDGVLTAGQMGQYQAALAEQREFKNNMRRQRKPAAEIPEDDPDFVDDGPKDEED